MSVPTTPCNYRPLANMSQVQNALSNHFHATVGKAASFRDEPSKDDFAPVTSHAKQQQLYKQRGQDLIRLVSGNV